MYDNFYETVKEEVSKRGLTVNKLSNAIGYDDKSVYNAFRNSVNGPGKVMLERIADHFGMACVYYKGEYRLVKAVDDELYMLKGENNG